MNKMLKYIRIRGTFHSNGEYLGGHAWIQIYQNVTMRDEHGEEVHFLSLLVPARLAEHIPAEIGDFYILRAKKGDRFVGALYAIDAEGRKSGDRADARRLVKTFARVQGYRGMILQSPITGATVIPLVAFVLLFVGHAMLGSFFGKLLPAAWIYYMLSPWLRQDQRAGVAQLDRILDENGFPSSSKSSSY